MSAKECADALRKVGFSTLEAEIYTYLLKQSPATGYGIAKGLGRHKPNVYEALNTLQAKGAVLVDEGEIRLYHAAPSEEIMRQLDRRFQKNRKHAIAMAKTMKRKEIDHRIYQLNTWDQVYEKGSTMLKTCKEVALIELDPWPLETFRDVIEKTAARGVRAIVRVYQQTQLKGVRTIVSPFASYSEKRWSTQLMTLIVDGKQFLMALVTPEEGKVHQAVWSASPFLTRQCFSFMNTDLLYYSLRPLLKSAESIEELKKEFQKLEEQFPIGKDPGYQDFQKLYCW